LNKAAFESPFHRVTSSQSHEWELVADATRWSSQSPFRRVIPSEANRTGSLACGFACFNPLSIESSVLSRIRGDVVRAGGPPCVSIPFVSGHPFRVGKAALLHDIDAIRSSIPFCRVIPSEVATTARSCSPTRTGYFNPLSAGSFLPRPDDGKKMADAFKFQSPLRRVISFEVMLGVHATSSLPSFNPLSIGSSVLRREPGERERDPARQVSIPFLSGHSFREVEYAGLKFVSTEQF